MTTYFKFQVVRRAAVPCWQRPFLQRKRRCRSLSLSSVAYETCCDIRTRYLQRLWRADVQLWLNPVLGYQQADITQKFCGANGLWRPYQCDAPGGSQRVSWLH